MGALISVVLILVALGGGRVLTAMAMRRMARSQGVREWIPAYGPRVPFLERGQADDAEEE
jgi:hypothetical protein